MELVALAAFGVLFSAFVVVPTQIQKRHSRRSTEE